VRMSGSLKHRWNLNAVFFKAAGSEAVLVGQRTLTCDCATHTKVLVLSIGDITVPTSQGCCEA